MDRGAPAFDSETWESIKASAGMHHSRKGGSWQAFSTFWTRSGQPVRPRSYNPASVRRADRTSAASTCRIFIDNWGLAVISSMKSFPSI